MYPRIALGLVLALSLSGASRAATYYVRHGGDDSADGLSPATAWATLTKVSSHSFSAGDSVLLHEGDTWTGQTLEVDWSGKSSKEAVVGAYYMNGSQPEIGYRTARPTLDGQKKVPSSQYAAMVTVKGDWIRVQDLAIANSEGRGILFDGVSSGQAVDLLISAAFDGSIKFMDSRNGLAAGNTITGSDRVFPETGRVWSAAISAGRSTGTIIRGNNILGDYGEGINVFENSSDSLIERNYLYGVRAVSIYADAAPSTTIRYNMVVGTTDRQFWRSADSVGAGIALNNESYHYQGHGGTLSSGVQSTHAKIYGNLVAYTSSGIGIFGQLENSRFDGTLIYNNTLVDNDVQFALLTANVPLPNSQFINNILLSLSPGTKDVNVSSLNGMVAKNNYFSQGDPGGDFSSAGNRYDGIELVKMTGWRSVKDSKALSWRDFQVKPGASTIGAGDDTPRTKATKADTYNVDYNGKAFGEPLDMGGLRFDSLHHVPGSPGGLSITAQ